MLGVCCICGEEGLVYAALCERHVNFAYLWGLVRAGKLSDWQMFHHDYMMTTDSVVGSTGDWQLEVQFILDSAG